VPLIQVDSADFFIEKEAYYEPLPGMHHHRSHELYYLVRGEREYFIEDRFFTVKEGDLVFVPKRVFHRTAGEGGLRFLVHFSDSFLHKFFTDAALSPILDRPIVFRGNEEVGERILKVLQDLLGEYLRSEHSDEIENEALFAGYLYQILFFLRHGENQYNLLDYEDDRLTGIIRYINENYNHIDRIEQIADHFYISKYHLCRFFRKKLNVPPIAYLNAIKIRHACVMMKNGCDNMTEIAMQCGFNSSSYFCKVFKKEKGITPGEYRKKNG